MVLPMLIETSPRFCKIIYKIFGPKQRGCFPSAHKLVDTQGPWTSSQVLSCCSLLPKASVSKCFIVSLLEGSCQWWLQNVLWNMTSSALKEAVSVAGIHAASYVWHLRSNRTGSREHVGLSGNLHSWFVLAAQGGEWVFILLFGKQKTFKLWMMFGGLWKEYKTLDYLYGLPSKFYNAYKHCLRPLLRHRNPIEIELNMNKWDGRLKRASISINIESLNTYLSGS